MKHKFEFSASERRDLLNNLDVLIKRPAHANEKTLAETIVGLNGLFSSLCQEKIEIRLIAGRKD
ncbi:hypothetical protein [Acinetobacter indicus]|uniref:hypothetical protein n=1 Tax=Acinetobacter indicus TaxID=756892 RepID=UPI0014439580|nr:hypothetical protein [Acinetobacter indicus]